MTGVRIAGGVISRKAALPIDTGVIKANFLSKLKDFGGHILLTKGWARSVFKSVECIEINGLV